MGPWMSQLLAAHRSRVAGTAQPTQSSPLFAPAVRRCKFSSSVSESMADVTSFFSFVPCRAVQCGAVVALLCVIREVTGSIPRGDELSAPISSFCCSTWARPSYCSARIWAFWPRRDHWSLLLLFPFPFFLLFSITPNLFKLSSN